MLAALGLVALLGCDDSAATTKSDASSRDAEAPSSCDPIGVWSMTYAGPDGGGSCAPSSDTVEVRPVGDGGYQVTFVGREPGVDGCGPTPMPGVLSSSITVSANGCRVEARWNTSWCWSGESQSEHRTLTLDLDANGIATGALTHSRAWCGGSGPSGKTTTLAARGTRRVLLWCSYNRDSGAFDSNCTDANPSPR